MDVPSSAMIYQICVSVTKPFAHNHSVSVGSSSPKSSFSESFSATGWKFCALGSVGGAVLNKNMRPSKQKMKMPCSREDRGEHGGYQKGEVSQLRIYISVCCDVVALTNKRSSSWGKSIVLIASRHAPVVRSYVYEHIDRWIR